MMSEPDERFRAYFRRKIADWNILDPRYDHRFYIEKKGKNALAEELAKDKDFQGYAGAYISSLLSGESESVQLFRVVLEDSISLLQEEKQDGLFREELETLLASVLEACDFVDMSSKVSMIRSSLVILAIAISLDAVLSTTDIEEDLKHT